MSYVEIFKQATDAISPINQLLKDDLFISSCAERLRGEGVVFEADSKDITVPYEGSGIYMFWADFTSWSNDSNHTWSKLLSEFLDSWDKPTESVSYFPKSNRGRAKTTLGNTEHGNIVPFYLGKSEHLAKRVDQHLYLDPNKKTYALKLKSRSEFLSGIIFQVTWLPLETTKDNYFLVSKVESLLREELSPIVGKQ